MRLQVNPTRMELLRLRKRLALAKRGHKLLKDKQDELMNKLQILIKKVKELREKVEKELEESIKRVLFARSSTEPEFLESALLIPRKELSFKIEYAYLLNVKIPRFVKEVKGEIICYGLAMTPPELDAALLSMEKVLEDLITLAEYEKALELLSYEIQKTRQRVNALEYVLIPALEETIKYITFRLSEMERSNLSRLMRIKEIIRGE